jgi:hypothetical protein
VGAPAVLRLLLGTCREGGGSGPQEGAAEQLLLMGLLGQVGSSVVPLCARVCLHKGGGVGQWVWRLLCGGVERDAWL